MTRPPKFPLLTKRQVPNTLKPETSVCELRSVDGALVAVTHLEYWSHVLVTAPKMVNFLGELVEVLFGQKQLTPRTSTELLLSALQLMGEACGESMAEGTEGGTYLAKILEAMTSANEPELEPEPEPTNHGLSHLPKHVQETLQTMSANIWTNEPFCEACGIRHPKGLQNITVVVDTAPSHSTLHPKGDIQ